MLEMLMRTVLWDNLMATVILNEAMFHVCCFDCILSIHNSCTCTNR